MPLGSTCLWRIVVQGGGRTEVPSGPCCHLSMWLSSEITITFVRPTGFNLQLISTDVSFIPRMHDPFQPSTICGSPWEPRICQLCPFCSPGLYLERRAWAPLILLHSDAFITPPCTCLGLSSFHPPRHLCPNSGLLPVWRSSRPLFKSLASTHFDQSRVFNVLLRALGFWKPKPERFLFVFFCSDISFPELTSTE